MICRSNKGPAVRVIVPVRTVSENNVREHWAKRARRVKTHRMLSKVLVSRHQPPLGENDRVRVTLVRVSPGVVDDDNLRGALKAVRDGVADALGVQDNDERVVWEYRQERGGRGEYSVDVQIEEWRE